MTRDHLDRHFTPLPLARVILAELVVRTRINVHRFVEPSAGGGAFLIAAREIWPKAHLIGVDIDPKAEARQYADEWHEGDWLDVSQRLDNIDLIAGNPPFTGEIGIDHVRASLACSGGSAVSVLVLPLGPLGGVTRWDPYMVGRNAPEEAWTIQPRPWPAKIRETAAFVWRRHDPEGTLVRRLPRWKAGRS